MVKPDSILEVVVLDVDQEQKRISLSLKQIEESPWETFKEKYAPGTRIKGTIRNVTDRGIFVEVDENIVGLVRPDNISWQGRVNPEESYEKDNELEVVILNVDVNNQRVALGVKQLSSDPWEEIQQKYKAGKSAVTGKVKEVTDRGLVIELEGEIEGYIRSNELQREGENRESTKSYNVGDEITAQVTGFDKRKRQVNLSKRRLEERLEKERVSDFISSQGEPNVTLGDVMKDKFKSINNDEVI